MTLVQCQIRHQLLQLPVLLLELPKPPELRHPPPVVLALPAVKRLLEYSHLPANLRDRRTTFGPPQGEGDLLLREPILLRDLRGFGTRKVSRKYNPGSVQKTGFGSSHSIAPSKGFRIFVIFP